MVGRLVCQCSASFKRWLIVVIFISFLGGFVGKPALAAPPQHTKPLPVHLEAAQDAAVLLTHTLTLHPTSVHPGGTVRVRGAGYTPNTTYYLLLGPMRATGQTPQAPTIDYYPITANGRGEVYGTFTFAPDQNPGVWYELYISATAGPPTVLAFAPVTVLPFLTYTPSADHGAPGDQINFTISNLDAGQLVIDLGGQVVYGPTTVLAGTHTHSFTVPQHPLGEPNDVLDLTILNLVDGLSAGRHVTTFTLDAASPDPEYQFVNLQITPARLIPGTPFTVTGQIVATGGQLTGPTAPPTGLSDLQAMWFDDDTGLSFPVGNTHTLLEEDGSFLLTARAASTVGGDPVSMQSGLGLNLYGKADDHTIMGSLYAPTPFTETLKILVLDVATNLPVSGVETTFNLLHTTSNITHTLDPDGVNFPPGTVRNWGQAIAHALSDSLSEYDYAAETDATGIAYQVFDGEHWAGNPLTFQTISSLNGLATQFQGGAIVSANAPRDDFWWPPTDQVGWQKYEVIVWGNHIRYFYDDPNLPPNSRTPFRTQLWFHPIRRETKDLWGVDIDTYEPFIVPMHHLDDPNPFDWGPPGATIFLNIKPGSYLNASYQGWLIYGGFWDFTALANSGVYLPYLPPITVEIPWDSTWEHINNPALYLDGFWVADFSYDWAGSKYVATFPYPTTWPTTADGSIYHALALKATYGGIPYYHLERRIYLKANPAAPWLADQSRYGNRSVTYNSVSQTFAYQGQEFNPANDSYGANDVSTTPAQTPQVGALVNNLSPVGVMKETAHVLGGSEREYTFASQSPQALSFVGDDKSSAASGTIMQFDKSYDPLLYVVVPLYAAAVADPLGGWIVTFTSGAYLESKADLAMSGSVAVGSDGRLHTDLLLNSHATVNGVMFVTADVLMGILGHAEFNFYPSLGLNMPLKLVDGDLDVGQIRFDYGMSLGYHIGIGCVCVPVVGCDCLAETADTIPLFEGSLPDSRLDNIPSLVTPPFGSAATAAPLCTTTPPARPVRMQPALAANGQGQVAAVWRDGQHELQTAVYENGHWSSQTHLINTVGMDVPAIAYYQPDQAIVTWNAYNEDEAILPTLPFTDALRSTYVAWAMYDTETLTEMGALAENANGAGGAVLGSCQANHYGCPEGGQVTAVWLVDRIPGMADTRTRLYYRIFEAGAWSAPAAIPLDSNDSDAQPQVLYRAGQPLIAFVRDADGLSTTTTDRRLAFFDPANPTVVEIPASLPGSIVEFSAALAANNNLRLAFTRIDAPNVGLIDNRHPLYTARQTCTGTCTWSYLKLLDPYGRAIFAESPSLTINNQGEANLAYRALGMGPDSNGSFAPHNGDTAGLTARTGEQANLSLNFEQQVVNPGYLTTDGAVNWEITSVYDYFNSQTIQMGVRFGGGAVQNTTAAPYHGSVNAQRVATEDDLMFATLIDQPDFAVYAIAPPDPTISGTKTITVMVQNLGTGWTGSGQPLRLAATWDDVDGLGQPAGEAWIDELQAGSSITLAIAVTPPFNPVLTHTLYIQAIPPVTIIERSVTNNEATLTLGGLPTPEALRGAAQNGVALTTLSWTPVSDARVIGYRIYRAVDDGAFEVVGSAMTTEWMDLHAPLDHTLTYQVTSFAANGIESPPSPTTTLVITAAATPPTIYLPFIQKGSSGTQGGNIR